MLSKFIGTIGIAHLHGSLNVGVGSLCLWLCVRLCLRVPLGAGTMLACGAAHGYGVARAAVAKSMVVMSVGMYILGGGKLWYALQQLGCEVL